MAAISFTALDVRPLPGAVMLRFVAASTCTPGQAVYVDGSGYAELADADAFASGQVIGIICSGPDGKVSFAAGDMVDVVCFGPVAGFSSLTPGGWVYSSITAGGMDQTKGTTGDYVHVVGTALSAVKIFVNPFTYDIASQ